MGNKYLDTKEGSLEQSVLGVWQTAIDESDARVDGRTKEYREHRKKLESARLRREKKNLNKEEVKLEEGSKEEYQKFFNAAMKKFGIDSPADLKSDEEKKKFFDYVDKNYKGEKDEEVQKLHQQLFPETKLKEAKNIDPKTAKIIAKKIARSGFDYGFGYSLSRNDIDDIKKQGGKPPRGVGPDGGGHLEHLLKALGADDIYLDGPDLVDGDKTIGKWKGMSIGDVFKKARVRYEEVEVKEGKMSQLHQLMKDGKTAEEIAKIMRLDAKTVKKLMAGYHESYEIGTDEYRKHTEDVTPGEDGEWVAAQKSKNDSMREALAKVWQTDEGKNPFKKESKKDLTKEVKDGKTMTGKKVASVDVNPKIMEKKK